MQLDERVRVNDVKPVERNRFAVEGVELGLIYDIDIINGVGDITMTLTAPGCPVYDVIPNWIRSAVMAVPGLERVDVSLTFDPPLTRERIRLGP